MVCGLLWRVVSRRELKEQAGRADLRPLIVWGQYHTAALLQSSRLVGALGRMSAAPVQAAGSVLSRAWIIN